MWWTSLGIVGIVAELWFPEKNSERNANVDFTILFHTPLLVFWKQDCEITRFGFGEKHSMNPWFMWTPAFHFHGLNLQKWILGFRFHWSSIWGVQIPFHFHCPISFDSIHLLCLNLSIPGDKSLSHHGVGLTWAWLQVSASGEQWGRHITSAKQLQQ